MKNIRNVGWVAVLWWVASACSSGPKTETVVTKVPVLKASSIYNPEVVFNYKEAHGDFHQEMAASYLVQAKAAEKENLAKAIYFTKRAITLQPTLEYYQQLAGYLQKAGEERELVQLYDLLVHQHEVYTLKEKVTRFVFEKPDEDLVYAYIALNVNDDLFQAGLMLRQAKDLDISVQNLQKRLLADPKLQLTPSSAKFKNLQLYLLTEEERQTFVKSEENFRNYLASFQDTAGTFEINEAQVAQFRYGDFSAEFEEGHSIEHFFMYFLQEKKEKPEEWPTYDLKRRVKVSDQVQAVVYAIDSSAAGCPLEMRHIYHRLVTYSPKGDILDSKVVATQSGEALSTLAFAYPTFTISDFRRTWKKPYKKYDFDNRVLKKEKIGERRFEVKTDGRIVEVLQTASPQPDTLLAQGVSPD